MATSAESVLNQYSQTTLGSGKFANWHAMFKLAGAAAVGSTSGKPYTEMASHFDSVLGAEHPVSKRYRADFSAELTAETR